MSAAAASVGDSIVPRYRVYLGDTIVLGPGKAEMLEHLAATGSISKAAQLMGMSYNRAWLHVQTMNDSFEEPLVTASRGGASGGGATLTEFGHRVLKLYRDMENAAQAATTETRSALSSLLKKQD